VAGGSVTLGILTTVTEQPESVTRYFEDYVPGLTIDCGSYTLSEAEIIAFARDFDPQPFHVDPEAARHGPFGGLIASGWHTASMSMRQVVRYYLSPESSLGSPGMEELRWPRPARPGEPLHAQITVLEARRSASRPDRGIVRGRMEVSDSAGNLVMTWTAANFVLLRDPSA
jgi:acyl dehydratase